MNIFTDMRAIPADPQWFLNSCNARWNGQGEGSPGPIPKIEQNSKEMINNF